MKHLKKILPTTLILIYILSFIAGLLLNIKAFVVTSNSMMPTFGVGDVLLAYSQEQYSQDDIISFKVEETIVTHRIKNIIHKDKFTYFQTKGDANIAKDSNLVAYQNVIGKTIFIIPEIGYLISFIQSKLFSIILIFTSIIYFSKLTYKRKKIK